MGAMKVHGAGLHMADNRVGELGPSGPHLPLSIPSLSPMALFPLLPLPSLHPSSWPRSE